MSIYTNTNPEALNLYRAILPSNHMKKNMANQGNRDDADSATALNKVACSQLNTVVLANSGEIFIAGSNSYGQLGFKEGKNLPSKPENKDSFLNFFHRIDFFSLENRKVRTISCGGEHIFAVTRNEIVFGWGRNDSGQLGLGYIIDQVYEPMLIRSVADITVGNIVCGDNYSAIVTSINKLMVAGNLEGGKLGLGKAWQSGLMLNFMEVPKVGMVKSVCCGPNHMLAICNSKKSNSGNSLYSWGRNWRGQLGLGNKNDQVVPRQIKMPKNEKFSKVAAGRDFSVALTAKTNRVYVWGNYRYVCNSKNYMDQESPTLLR